jgi:hypothetical protein
MTLRGHKQGHGLELPRSASLPIVLPPFNVAAGGAVK